MLKFDFDTLADRRHSGNMKFQSTPEPVRRAGAISYAGAEMDFKTAPVIIDALTQKAQNGLYGYTLCDTDYVQAVTRWMASQRHWQILGDWVLPTYGTLQGLSIAIRAFTQKGDGIILQNPVYMRYKEAIDLNERICVISPLRYERDASGACYSVDFDDLERCMALEKTKMMVLCNPHNPVAKVWQRADLERVAALAKTYNVLVFSDEIFAEVTFPGFETIPYSTLPDAASHCIVSTSLGKTFNFTGFSHANMIIPNAELRQAFRTQRDIDHYGSIDPFIYAALLAAYQNGGEWVGEMVKYVYDNVLLIQQFFAEKMPQIVIAKPEGTFVIWIDWHAFGLQEEALNDFLVNEAFLDLDPGSHYGNEGTGFSRMNVAAPRAEIQKSLTLLYSAAQKRGLVPQQRSDPT